MPSGRFDSATWQQRQADPVLEDGEAQHERLGDAVQDRAEHDRQRRPFGLGAARVLALAAGADAITLPQARGRAKVQHMEEGYTQLGTVLTDQRPEDSEGDSVIVVGRFKGDPYDGVQLSYNAGRRNLYLTPEGALRLAFLLAVAVDRDIDIR